MDPRFFIAALHPPKLIDKLICQIKEKILILHFVTTIPRTHFWNTTIIFLYNFVNFFEYTAKI